MSISIASRRMSSVALHKRYGDAVVLDLTSRAPEPWVRFSPYYPHGNIPVPFSPGHSSMTVEGIWQALKVFEHADVDPTRLRIANMKGIKRSERTYGKILGHRAGLEGDRFLGYEEARRSIYLPSYRWVLDYYLGDLVAELRQLNIDTTLVLLDYAVNSCIEDLSRPLSHASLVKSYVEGKWPT